MSNITGDESFSSENNTGGGGEEVQQHLLQGHQFHGQSAISDGNGSVSQPTPPVKKKRNLPGNPDPAAEVIALSPTTLMATNRFICEICNKGFQRDQNLQLHRRGHNLPWKLRQRPNNEVARKRVYVCPEVWCVHHNPARALGDLTGIKKHFCRKHGEKKWKCDKCSKKYAVQSDWKAHSKTCGTREYKCDCGTIFSRRDSFITHRAFCDALAEENNKPPPPPATTTTPNSTAALNPSPDFAPALDIKQQHQLHPLPSKSLTMFPGAGAAATTTLSSTSSPSIFSLPSSALHLTSPPPPPPPSSSGAHISATALLQKAAEMGATARSNNNGNHNNNRSQMVYDVGLGLEGMNQVQFFDGTGSSNNGLTVDFLGVGGARPLGVLDHPHHNSNPFHHHNHNHHVHDQFHYHHHESGMMMHQFQQQEQQQVGHGHGVIDKPMWGDVL